MRRCVLAKDILTFIDNISFRGLAICPLWWPGLTKDLQTKLKKRVLCNVGVIRMPGASLQTKDFDRNSTHDHHIGIKTKNILGAKTRDKVKSFDKKNRAKIK